MGRSKIITGPYLDKDGICMRDGGGSMILQAITPSWKGPGHEAIFSEAGQDDLVFHAYNGNNCRVGLHI